MAAQDAGLAGRVQEAPLVSCLPYVAAKAQDAPLGPGNLQVCRCHMVKEASPAQQHTKLGRLQYLANAAAGLQGAVVVPSSLLALVQALPGLGPQFP